MICRAGEARQRPPAREERAESPFLAARGRGRGSLVAALYRGIMRALAAPPACDSGGR